MFSMQFVIKIFFFAQKKQNVTEQAIADIA
jgi:hypothetical protein